MLYFEVQGYILGLFKSCILVNIPISSGFHLIKSPLTWCLVWKPKRNPVGASRATSLSLTIAPTYLITLMKVSSSRERYQILNWSPISSGQISKIRDKTRSMWAAPHFLRLHLLTREKLPNSAIEIPPFPHEVLRRPHRGSMRRLTPAGYP